MPQGTVIAQKATFATSTTESANQVIATYDNVGPGQLNFYCKPSDANVRVNLFVNGQQVLRNAQMASFGTTGTLDTSANHVTAWNTAGGRVELTFVATTGTPTVDFILTHTGIPLITSLINFFKR